MAAAARCFETTGNRVDCGSETTMQRLLIVNQSWAGDDPALDFFTVLFSGLRKEYRRIRKKEILKTTAKDWLDLEGKVHVSLLHILWKYLYGFVNYFLRN